ncbi:MAG: LPXTG cell wall anchor domain-containing protein [Polyangiaceae bacterium]
MPAGMAFLALGTLVAARRRKRS